MVAGSTPLWPSRGATSRLRLGCTSPGIAKAPGRAGERRGLGVADDALGRRIESDRPPQTVRQVREPDRDVAEAPVHFLGVRRVVGVAQHVGAARCAQLLGVGLPGVPGRAVARTPALRRRTRGPTPCRRPRGPPASVPRRCHRGAGRGTRRPSCVARAPIVGVHPGACERCSKDAAPGVPRIVAACDGGVAVPRQPGRHGSGQVGISTRDLADVP